VRPGRFPTYAAEERLRERRERGEPVVPLHGTATPALPAHVVDAVAAALAAPQRTAPARGLNALREALAGEIERSTGRTVDPATELLVTNGAMHALGVCFRALLAPGDEVVVPAPSFFFEGPVRAAGGAPVYVPSTTESGWRWDPSAVAAAIGPRTRALLLCNPGNPTGTVPARAEVEAVVGVAADAGLLVVTDEAYEASLWGDARLASAFAAAEDVVLVRSLGKSLSLPTLRLGLLAGPPARMERCVDVLEWDCLRVGVAPQHAAIAALAGDRGWLDDVHRSTEVSLGIAVRAVTDAGLDFVPPAAAPFLFVGDGSDPGLAGALVQAGLPVVDGVHFQAPGFARLPFGGAAEARSELEQALSRFAALRGA
jgi:aspartate/methionine/tyrosine aminotransferase